MKASTCIFASFLFISGSVVNLAASAEAPAKTKEAPVTTKSSPDNSAQQMAKCSQADMKNGACAQGGMDHDHMQKMHDHMQQMHSAVPEKKTEPAKPASAEDHAAHHPAK